MNSNSKNRTLFAALLAAFAFLLCGYAGLAHAQNVSVSIPSLNLMPKERVVGFDIHITSGRVARLSDLPIGWSISVDNDASWNTSAKGTSTVGAAAVDPSFFKNFVVVEKNESLGIPFDVQGEVVVTADFATERRIKFALKDLVITKLSGKGVEGER